MPRGQRVLAGALYRLRVQINRLGYLVERIARRDEALYDRYVVLVERGDRVAASMVAAEIAGLRRTARSMLTARYVLERIALRLETVMQINDGSRRFVGLAPVVGVLGEVRLLVRGIGDPELALELAEIHDMLRGLLGDVELGEYKEEAHEIMKKAAMLAEELMRERFPELPTHATLLQARQG